MKISATLSLPTLNGPGAAVDTAGMGGTKSVAVTGSFQGCSIIVEVSVDGASFAPVASFQSPGGTQTIVAAARFMRISVSGRVQGSLVPFVANAQVTSNDTGCLFDTIPLPPADGNGASVDTSAFGLLSTIIVGGELPGAVVRIQGSDAGVDWSDICQFSGQGGIWTGEITETYVRAVVSGRRVTAPFTATAAIGAVNDSSPSAVEQAELDAHEDRIDLLDAQVATLIAGAGASTGATFNGIINALDFCTGDGVTDDRVGMQAAMNAAVNTGKALFIPPGTYRVSRFGSSAHCLRPIGPITIIGAGRKSILKTIPDNGFTLVLLNLQDINGIVVRDLVIDGDWGNASTSVKTTTNLPAASINVASTASFPAAGTAFVQNTDGIPQKLTWTGKTATSFTGVTATPGTGTLAMQAVIGSHNSAYGLNHRTYAVWVGNIAAGSDGQAINALAGGELHVDTMAQNLPGAGWPFVTEGTISLLTNDGWQKVRFTGKDEAGLKFTGVTALDGGTGTIVAGSPAYHSADPKSHGISVYINTQNVLIENVHCRQIYGDGMRIGSGLLVDSARNITVRKFTTEMCARNGITVSSRSENVLIDDCAIDNVFTTAVDCEPELDSAWVRKLVIRATTMGSLQNRGTWFQDHGSISENVLSIGGSSSTHPQPNNYIQGIRVENCKIFGSVTITDGVDVVIRNNTIYNINPTAWPAIYTTIYANDIWIDGNWIYDLAVAPVNGFPSGSGAIHVMRYATSPLRMRISNNAVHVRGGKSGIHIEGSGGKNGGTGIADEIVESVYIPGVENTPGYLVDNEATWADAQHNGLEITVDGRLNTIATTIAATKRLQFGVQSNWTDAFGNDVPAPAPGPYTIHTAGGVVDVDGNTVDARGYDGNTAGGYGIKIQQPQVENCRFRILRNSLRGCTTAGIYIGAPNLVVNAFRLLEIADNHVWDDQQVVTCTKGIEFSSMSNLGKLIMRGNNCEVTIATPLAGAAGGRWLVNDGHVQQWMGYGAPGALAAPSGSTYQRVDPANANEVLYVRAAGAWAAK